MLFSNRTEAGEIDVGDEWTLSHQNHDVTNTIINTIISMNDIKTTALFSCIYFF